MINVLSFQKYFQGRLANDKHIPSLFIYPSTNQIIRHFIKLFISLRFNTQNSPMPFDEILYKIKKKKT